MNRSSTVLTVGMSPEWKDPSPNFSISLTHIEVLQAAGIDEEMIDYFVDNNNAVNSIAHLRIQK